jgi:hypothetical protein
LSFSKKYFAFVGSSFKAGDADSALIDVAAGSEQVSKMSRAWDLNFKFNPNLVMLAPRGEASNLNYGDTCMIG